MSKLKNNQKGFSTVIVLLVIIILILVGFVGYYVWNTQHNKKTSQNQQTTATTNTTRNQKTTTQSAPAENKNLVIKEWGIQIPVTAGYSYKVVDANTVQVTNQAITDAAKTINCSDIYEGSIIRKQMFEAGEPVTLSSKINGYYYGFHPRSQSACLDDQGNYPNPNTVNSLMMDALNKLNVAMPKTSAI